MVVAYREPQAYLGRSYEVERCLFDMQKVDSIHILLP